MVKTFILFLQLSIPLFAFLAPDDITLVVAAAKPDATLFLKYQSYEGDYLVFYDREGSTLLLKYRVDKWDYANDMLRDYLQQGITYRVTMKSLKNLPEEALPPGVRGSGLPKVVHTRKIRKIRDIYLADLQSVNESALRDLRL